MEAFFITIICQDYILSIDILTVQNICSSNTGRATTLARVVELVDTQDLKSCSHCESAGSIPAPGTRPLVTRSYKGLLFCDRIYFFNTTYLVVVTY